MFGFGAMLIFALIAGLAFDNTIDPDRGLREQACEMLLAEDKPATEWVASELLAKDACDAAHQTNGAANGVYAWPSDPQVLQPPYAYTHYSGFIITNRTILSVARAGFIHGVICRDSFFRYGTQESHSLGGEWEPDERRWQCVEAHADDVMEYEVLSGPNENNYFVVAVRHRKELYIGWAFIRTLDFEETIEDPPTS